MKSSISIAAALVLLVSGPSLATEHNQPSGLDITCNSHGKVVRVPDGRVYYLGKDGDAAQEGVSGGGRWWTAASGFIVEINGQSVRFNEDPDCVE